MSCVSPRVGSRNLLTWKLTYTGVPWSDAYNDKPEVFVPLPCGKCIGCRRAVALSWVVRCTAELREHESSCWATLTYAPDCLPHNGRLCKRDMQLFLKRLRHKYRFKYFIVGEYGERYGRPHYHAIFFGIPESARSVIESVWDLGQVRVDAVNRKRIAYAVGYTHIKQQLAVGERCRWMSRNPAIGRSVRDAFAFQHRDYAVLDGVKVPVPRYFHMAWKAQASEEDVYFRDAGILARSVANPVTDYARLSQRLSAESRSRDAAIRRLVE